MCTPAHHPLPCDQYSHGPQVRPTVAAQTLAIELGNSLRNRFVGAIASASSGELEPHFAAEPLEVEQDFFIRVGEREPVEVPAGRYRTPQELATAIDRALGSTGRAPDRRRPAEPDRPRDPDDLG